MVILYFDRNLQMELYIKLKTILTNCVIYIGYVFNRQNKQDVEDNRFQQYLLITDLLEAHVAALLEHERINMIRA